MKIQQHGQTLNISEVTELALVNSDAFRTAVASSLSPALKEIEIDLSQTDYMDCAGLGALIALHKSAQSQNGGGVTVRLRNPTPNVRQLFELTRVNEMFAAAA